MAYKRQWRDERIFGGAFRVKIMVNGEGEGVNPMTSGGRLVNLPGGEGAVAAGEAGLGGFGIGLINIA